MRLPIALPRPSLKSILVAGGVLIVATLVLPPGLRSVKDSALGRQVARRVGVDARLSEKVPAAPAAALPRAAIQPPLPGGGALIPATVPSGALALLIRTGQMTVEVVTFDQAFARVQSIVTERGGYIADIHAQREDQGRAQGTLTLRVPPAQFFLAMDALRGLGKVRQEAVNTQDVTRTSLDLEARLKQKRELYARMKEIYLTKSQNLEALVEAQQQLSDVATTIEQMEAEQRYLQHMVALSTLTLTLHEPAAQPKVPTTHVLSPLKVAAEEGVASVVHALATLLGIAIFLLPWGALAWMTWKLALRLWKRRVPPAVPAPPQV